MADLHANAQQQVLAAQQEALQQVQAAQQEAQQQVQAAQQAAQAAQQQAQAVVDVAEQAVQSACRSLTPRWCVEPEALIALGECKRRMCALNKLVVRAFTPQVDYWANDGQGDADSRDYQIALDWPWQPFRHEH